MYRYREFPVPGIFHSLVVSETVSANIDTRTHFGTGKKFWNWYWKNLLPEKVPEPVLEKFDTGTDFRRQNLEILNIYSWLRHRIGIGTGNFFLVVSEPVSVKFGTVKKWYRYQKYLVPEKCIGII